MCELKGSDCCQDSACQNEDCKNQSCWCKKKSDKEPISMAVVYQQNEKT
jgi:hypothetical protein